MISETLHQFGKGVKTFRGLSWQLEARLVYKKRVNAAEEQFLPLSLSNLLIEEQPLLLLKQ